MSDTDGWRPIVVSGDARRLRVRLGPVAWVVLEELVARSALSEDGEVRWVSYSHRSLGSLLGLDKDTVARALGRLTAEGLVRPSQSRAGSGRFAASIYEVALPTGLSVVPDEPISADSAAPVGSETAAPANRSARRPVRVRSIVVSRPVEQLSLLDA